MAEGSERFLQRAVRLLSLSMKARHEGCIHQAERLAAMAAQCVEKASAQEQRSPPQPDLSIKESA